MDMTVETGAPKRARRVRAQPSESELNKAIDRAARARGQKLLDEAMGRSGTGSFSGESADQISSEQGGDVAQPSELEASAVAAPPEKGLPALLKGVNDLIGLHKRAAAAKIELNEAIDATAERAKLSAAVVRKFIAARAGDHYEERREEVRQLALVFRVDE